MEDYKEKYESALKVASKWHKDGIKDIQSVIECIFPELKESEDEKIRKEIIEFICWAVDRGSITDKQRVKSNLWVAWLEKQNEQKTVSKTEPIIEGLTTEFQKQLSYLIASTMNKEYKYTKGYVEWVAQSLLGYAKNEQTSTNKVEPKFKVGDWIYHERSGNTFRINKIENGLYVSDIGATISLGRQNDWRTWTIKDAKNGDVLSFNDGHGNNCIELIKSITDKKIEFWFCLTNGNYYEVFDGITPYTNFASREDATPATRKQRDQLEKAMKEAGYEWDAKKKELKKIEQTYFQKQKWTGYDEKAYEIALLDIDKSPSITKNDTINWLKSLKNRVQQPQSNQKPAWSEEDEDNFITALWHVKRSSGREGCVYNWLKSLKERYTWKPSDKQIGTLEQWLRNNRYEGDARYCYPIFDSLYQDLKKLREE